MKATAIQYQTVSKSLQIRAIAQRVYLLSLLSYLFMESMLDISHFVLWLDLSSMSLLNVFINEGLKFITSKPFATHHLGLLLTIYATYIHEIYGHSRSK